MCLSDKQCEGLSEIMSELGLSPQHHDVLLMVMVQSGNSAVNSRNVIATEVDSPVIPPLGDIARHIECGRITKMGKHQLLDPASGGSITLSLRDFDEFCHDIDRDDDSSDDEVFDSSKDEVVVCLLTDMYENDHYGRPAH